MLQVQHMTISRKFRVFHNVVKPHMGLDGATPAEKCGVQVKGDNKWKTIIQNAASAEIGRGVQSAEE